MEAEAGRQKIGRQAGKQRQAYRSRKAEEGMQAIIDADAHASMDESGDQQAEAARQRERDRLAVPGTKRQACRTGRQASADRQREDSSGRQPHRGR
jgi:hypothetical protein